MSSLAINSYTSRPPRVVGHFCWGFSWSINSTIDELKSRRVRLQPSTIQSPVVTDASHWSEKFFFTIERKIFCFSWKRLKKLSLDLIAAIRLVWKGTNALQRTLPKKYRTDLLVASKMIETYFSFMNLDIVESLSRGDDGFVRNANPNEADCVGWTHHSMVLDDNCCHLPFTTFD